MLNFMQTLQPRVNQSISSALCIVCFGQYVWKKLASTNCVELQSAEGRGIGCDIA